MLETRRTQFRHSAAALDETEQWIAECVVECGWWVPASAGGGWNESRGVLEWDRAVAELLLTSPPSHWDRRLGMDTCKLDYVDVD